MKKSLKKQDAVKTVTLNAQVAVSKTETGMNYVQVMPDNPIVGQVEAFRGLGYGQMLSTGMFEYTRHKRVRSQAVTLLKLPHSSVSRCKDGTHRFTFIVKDEELEKFCLWLALESVKASAFMRKYQESVNVEKEAA
jgi:hypothetical protein